MTTSSGIMITLARAMPRLTPSAMTAMTRIHTAAIGIAT